MSVGCAFKADRNYQSVCGAPAVYEVWGDPCSCTHAYDLDKCTGHPVCVEHGARIRMVEVRVHREREQPFKLLRIRDLPTAEPVSSGCSEQGGAQ